MYTNTPKILFKIDFEYITKRHLRRSNWSFHRNFVSLVLQFENSFWFENKQLLTLKIEFDGVAWVHESLKELKVL